MIGSIAFWLPTTFSVIAKSDPRSLWSKNWQPCQSSSPTLQLSSLSRLCKEEGDRKQTPSSDEEHTVAAFIKHASSAPPCTHINCKTQHMTSKVHKTHTHTHIIRVQWIISVMLLDFSPLWLCVPLCKATCSLLPADVKLPIKTRYHSGSGTLSGSLQDYFALLQFYPTL